MPEDILSPENPVLLLDSRVVEGNLDGAFLRDLISAAYQVAHRRALVFGSVVEPSYRDMVTLGSLDLDEVTPEVARLYERVQEVLATLLGRPVFAVPDTNERYVLNVLDRPFDQQGRHVDTYAYAVNFMFEAPRRGGALEIVFERRTVALAFPTGSWYALRTDVVPHAVAPIVLGRRIVLNFAYHSTDDGATQSYSSDRLYATARHDP